MTWVLYILQKLEEKSRQMTILDFGPLRSSVNTAALTSYDTSRLRVEIVDDGELLGICVHTP